MPRTLATALAAGVLGIGVATATVVGVPAVASAVTGQPSEDAVSQRVTAIRDALQGLVDDSTITDEQADKVADTLGRSEQFRGGPGSRDGGFGFGIRGPEGLQTLAGALGMSEDDLRTALRDGTTIADLAEKQGKDVADVEAALVKAATERIDQAVKDGRLTQEQADRVKSNLADRVKQFVENGGGKFGRGFGGRGGFGGHGPGDAPASPGSPTPSPSATTESSLFTTA